MSVENEKMDELAELKDKLRRTQEALKIMHETLRSGMWGMTFDEQANMTSCTWSDEFRHMIGYVSTKDFPDKLESWSDLLHPKDKRAVLKEFEDTIHDFSGGKTYDVEYRLRTKNGVYRWFHAAGRLIRREDGSPEEYIGMFIDITDRKTAQERLKQALQQAEDANKAKSDYYGALAKAAQSKGVRIIKNKDGSLMKYDPDADTVERLTEADPLYAEYIQSQINRNNRVGSGRNSGDKTTYGYKTVTYYNEKGQKVTERIPTTGKQPTGKEQPTTTVTEPKKPQAQQKPKAKPKATTKNKRKSRTSL